jgi:VWFA-related protein
MKCLRPRSATFALLGILFSPFAFVQLTAQSSADVANSTFDRTLAESFSSILIENPAGRTEIQTWSSNRVRVTATQSAGDSAKALDSRIQLERPAAEALKIRVSPGEKRGGVNLLVYVPHRVSLSVRGGTQDVVIKGLTSSISVETESGNIALQLPATANTDLSLRSIEGTISAKVPLVFFGPVNSHALDGKTGDGGTPVVLRSTRGSIDLTPDDPRRRAGSENEVANNFRNAPMDISYPQNAVLGTVDDRAARQGETHEQTNGTGGFRSAAADQAAPPDDVIKDVIKIDTRMVNLNVKVTDASGKLLPDLTKEDFQAFENNVEQDLVYFAPVTAPVNLVLLLDLSGSTKDRMKVMKKAAKKFIDTLNPNTRIAVAGFSRKFMVISDFTDDRKLLKNRIDDLKNFQSGTAFYDAMWHTLDLFNEVREKRRAVVVLTDGVDNSLSSDEYEPRHPFDELLSRLTQNDITIYPIYFDTEYETIVKRRGSDTHEAYVTARKQLNNISETTGGTLFKADRAEELDSVYERVAAELHTMYSVAYYPKDKDYDGKWRQVQMKVRRPQGVTKTKPGYYAK